MKHTNRPHVFVSLQKIQISFSILLTFNLLGCTVTNPDFDDSLATDEGGSLISTGGEIIGGEIVGGEIVGGEIVGGEIVGGEIVGGEIVGGEIVGGEIVGGEIVGGEIVGGEIVGGEIVGGEIVGGEIVGGEIVGGEIVGGMMNADRDGDRYSPPEDCDDMNPSINPEGTELCDDVDNDCDGKTDEGLLNDCGRCGPTDAEVCDGFDNDCDGISDEGTLNACNACGPLPVEICDGGDNDCDGRTDEGLLNACNACGPLPAEICDGSDNDCDGNVDEGLPLNDCGSCGLPPTEVCDGADNDCDRQVDEGLLAPCFHLLHTINAPDTVRELGESIHITDDLNGDGVPDAVVRGRRYGRIRLIALSGMGDILWSVNGDGDFATALTSGRFQGAQTLIVANDPLNNRVVLYTESGTSLGTISISEGEVISLTTLRQATQVPLLVMGIPTYRASFQGRDHGLILALQFTDPEQPTQVFTVYSTNGSAYQEWGERIFAIGDIDGDSTEDLIFTRLFNRGTSSDTGTQLMSGATGTTIPMSLFTVQDSTEYSFATAVEEGKWSATSERGYAFGAPFVSNPVDHNGAIYFLNETQFGFEQAAPSFGMTQDAERGLALARLPRPSRSADVLIIGGNGQVRYRDFATGAEALIPAPDSALYIGPGVNVSQTAQPDGTYRFWMSGISNTAGEGKIWIFSAR